MTDNESNVAYVAHLFSLVQQVRLAERSKAPDLSSGSRERAWVRTPHLTIRIGYFFFFK